MYLSVDEVQDPRRWYSTNLVGIPAQLLAAVDFNDDPQRLRIATTRATHRGLFALLDEVRSLQEAAGIFSHYMRVAFGIGQPQEDTKGRHWRSSYTKLLQGWGFDANSPQGAVLKGWVESRFGIVPTFHGGRLEEFPSEPWMRYLEEKLSSRFHNNCIQLQLDVLYEYCQWCLENFPPFTNDGRFVTLYRGIERSEADFLRGSVAERWGVLRFNNVVSFSVDREQADPFGEWLVKTRIPFERLLFFPGLLGDRVLTGEGEVLVIGGDFRVDVSYC